MSTGSQDDLRNCTLLDLFGRCLKKSKINGNIGHIFHGRLLKHFRMDYSDMSASLGAHFSMMRRSCVSQVTMATQHSLGHLIFVRFSTTSFMGNVSTNTLQGTNISLTSRHFRVDDFTFPKAGYVSFQEGFHIYIYDYIYNI